MPATPSTPLAESSPWVGERPSVWLRRASAPGQIVSGEAAHISVFDRGLVFGESVYEVIPIIGGQPRLLEAHANRFGEGAAMLGLGAPSKAELAELCEVLVQADGMTEGLLYAQLTGGEALRAHIPSPAPLPTLMAYLMSYQFPRGKAESERATVTLIEDTRWRRCNIKSTMLLSAVQAKRQANARGADEAIFFDAQGISEGSSSNFFMVKSGVLITPPLSGRLLPGVTRNAVIALAKSNDIEVREQLVSRKMLAHADEVFLTSTGRTVWPVRAFDEGPEFDHVGVVTQQLGRLLRDHLGLSAS